MIASSMFGSDVACKFHVKKMSGLMDRLGLAVENTNARVYIKTRERLLNGLYDLTEHCGAKNEYTVLYKKTIVQLVDIKQ